MTAHSANHSSNNLDFLSVNFYTVKEFPGFAYNVVYGVFINLTITPSNISCPSSFQQFSVAVAAFQYTHLMDGYFVQFHKPLALRNAILKWSNSTTLKSGL